MSSSDMSNATLDASISSSTMDAGSNASEGHSAASYSDPGLPPPSAGDADATAAAPPLDASKQSIQFGVSFAQQLRVAHQARAAYRPFGVEPFLSREVLRVLPSGLEAAPKTKRRTAFVSEPGGHRVGEGGGNVGGVSSESLGGLSKVSLIKLLGPESDSENVEEGFGGEVSAESQSLSAAPSDATVGKSDLPLPAARGESAEDLQQTYETLLSDIGALEQKNQKMFKHLERIRSFSALPGGGVAIAVLGFHCDRLVRARQLEASKSADAADQYTTFCTNQRDNAIRRAQNDMEEIARRSAKLEAPLKVRRGSVVATAAAGTTASALPDSVRQDLIDRTSELLHFDMDELQRTYSLVKGPRRAVETDTVGVSLDEIPKKSRELIEKFRKRINTWVPSDSYPASTDAPPLPLNPKSKAKGELIGTSIPPKPSMWSDADVEAFISDNPVIVSNLSELGMKSNAAIRKFEEQEIMDRLQRCVIHAKKALNKKLINLDGSPDDGFDTYRSRIFEREKVLDESFDAIKKLGDDMSEVYLQRVRRAHQLVLEQQLGRIERLQQRLHSLESGGLEGGR